MATKKAAKKESGKTGKWVPPWAKKADEKKAPAKKKSTAKKK